MPRNKMAKLASKPDSNTGQHHWPSLLTPLASSTGHHHWSAPLAGIIGKDPWQHVPNASAGTDDASQTHSEKKQAPRGPNQ